MRDDENHVNSGMCVLGIGAQGGTQTGTLFLAADSKFGFYAYLCELLPQEAR